MFRGYYAGLLFRGMNFEPKVEWAFRRVEGGRPGEEKPGTWERSGRAEIQNDRYFEVSTHYDPEEAPLSWRGFDFAVRNPDGQMSEWARFSFPFDDAQLERTLERSTTEGRRLFSTGEFRAAIEPLRKAMVYSDRLHGYDAPTTVALRDEWNAALHEASRAEMRFKVGDHIKMTSGKYDGASGEITATHLRHAFPYTVKLDTGEQVQVADREAEKA